MFPLKINYNYIKTINPNGIIKRGVQSADLKITYLTYYFPKNVNQVRYLEIEKVHGIYMQKKIAIALKACCMLKPQVNILSVSLINAIGEIIHSSLKFESLNCTVNQISKKNKIFK